MFENRRSIAICLNGHLMDSDSRGLNNDENKFCDSCGEEVVKECPSCDESIRGNINQAPAGQGPLGPWIEEHVRIPDFCLECGCEFPWANTDEGGTTQAGQSETGLVFDSIELVTHICNEFPTFAKQLDDRYNNREGIGISDEYDVQDVLHPVLRMFFDDVRPEESTESYAGGSSRIDFLLKKPSIGIEVKFMHESSSPQKIGDELLADKERYSIHSECEYLVSFIYDPNNAISNPIGMEEDLTYNTDQHSVRTIVAPK